MSATVVGGPDEDVLVTVPAPTGRGGTAIGSSPRWRRRA
jgi:hypothetical protein